MLTVQVQMSPGCGHGRQTVELVRQVLHELAPEARVERIEILTMEDAERVGFRGSPTVLIEGVDIDPDLPAGVGLG
jgi:hypothetical protein